MGRTFLIVILCIAPLSIWSQEKPATQEEADKLDSLVSILMRNQHYEDALQTKMREIDILKQLRGEKDSLYLRQKALSGKIYYRLGKREEAAKITTEAAEEYGKYVSSKDKYYAFFLDNASLYWASIKEFDKGKELSLRAFKAYEQLRLRDFDFAAILMHLAENCDGAGQPQEAIKYDLLALDIFKNTVREHSDSYIEELSYLQKYYEHAGDSEKAKKTKEHAELLTAEKEQGYVDLPEPVQFETAEICHEHNDDALICITYYLTHLLVAPNMDQAAQYIINWSAATADVNVVVGKKQAMMERYMIAYIAATAYFCLTENTKVLDEPLFVKAITALLDFYKSNRVLTGKVDVLEDYLKLQDKGKLENQLHKDFLANQQKQ